MANNRIQITIEAKDDASRSIERASESAVKANKNVSNSAKSAANSSKISAAELSASFDSVASGIGKVLTKSAALATAGSFGIGAMAKASLDQVSAVEQATVALRAYESNASKVTKTLADLVKYAQSPMGVLFQRQDLFAAAQGLKIMGDNTGDLTKHVEIMSRSVGLGLSTFEGLGNVIQRVGSTGRLYADDLQFLQNAGFRLDSSLSGTRQSFQSLFALLDKGIPANAMAGQADTIKGKLVTLQSGFRGLGNQFLDVDAKTSQFVKGGLGDSLMNGLDSLIKFLKTPEMKSGFAEMGTSVATFTKAALPMIQNVLSWLVNNTDTVVAGVGALASAFIAAKVAAVALSVATSPLTAIAAAAAVVAGGIAFLQIKFNIFGKATKAVSDGVGFLHKSVLVPIGDFFKGAFKSSVDAGQKAIGWLKDRVDDAGKSFQDFKGWLKENETAIKTVATVLTVVFGPALAIAAGKAVVAGVKIAASGLVAGAGWVKGAASSTAAWIVWQAKMLIISTVVRANMIKDAIVASAAWAKNAVVSSAAWVFEMTKVALATSKTAIVSVLKAADAGWAWVFNATRVAFVWTINMAKVVGSMALTAGKAVIHAAASALAWTKNAAIAATAWVITELPKIVASFVATAISATTQAAISSAAWVKNAAISSTAWVIYELPKIVAAFIATSISSVVQAGIASAAWISGASKVAIAWVVTQLPRIVAAFIATSAAAITQAGIASGAWIASAAKSSGAVRALSALVATPLVMPAIAIAAALGAIAKVVDAYKKMKSAVQDAESTWQEYDSWSSGEMARRKKILYDPKSSKKEKDAARRVIRQLASHASGTNAAPGGRTLVGEHGPEVVDLPTGSRVTPAYRSRTESTVQGGHTVIIQTLNVNNGGDYNRMLSDIGFALETAS